MDQRFAVRGVDASTPLPQAAQALLLAKAEPLFALEDAARAGEDMDAVHDMRVASRRLREAMRLLQPLYPDPEFDRFYHRVRSVTKALGPVRDSDVFIDEFAQLIPELGDGGRRAAAFLIGHRMGTREYELIRMGHKLSRLGLEGGKRELRKIARSVADSDDKRCLADFAHAAVAERSAVVFGALPSALIAENVLQQHALRIDFKRLRYAVEFFAVAYSDEFDELHETLTAFQDGLGELHDLHLFLDMLKMPDRIALAARAGVSEDDLADVRSVLERRAQRTFEEFSRLAAEHPAPALLGGLLLPLSRRPEPAESPEPEAESEPEAEPAAQQGAETAAIVEFDVEDPLAAPAVSLAVQLEPEHVLQGDMQPHEHPASDETGVEPGESGS
jgi:CHAD domain-containing protein